MSTNCQKCGALGLSISAMNYKEIKNIEKDGSFQGGGVGIGTGGLGLMVGGGTYSETDEISTKRAKCSLNQLPPICQFMAALL